MSNFDYDVLVIGSGFGGSVTALRLTEKGYRVGVLEAGRRFDDPTIPHLGSVTSSLPKTSWRVLEVHVGAAVRPDRDPAHPPAAR